MFCDDKHSGGKYSRIRGIGSDRIGGLFINLIKVVMVNFTEQDTFQ